MKLCHILLRIVRHINVDLCNALWYLDISWCYRLKYANNLDILTNRQLFFGIFYLL